MISHVIQYLEARMIFVIAAAIFLLATYISDSNILINRFGCETTLRKRCHSFNLQKTNLGRGISIPVVQHALVSGLEMTEF